MIPKQLARELLKLSEKTSPGPWIATQQSKDKYPAILDGFLDEIAYLTAVGDPWDNAFFIAYARNLIPTLAQEIIRLAEENEKMAIKLKGREQ